MIKIQKFHNPSKTIQVYHGSNYEISKFEHFNHEKYKNESYGPGIYFTNDKETAERYGKYLYTIKLNTAGFITSKSRIDRSTILNIIDTNVDDMILSNYSESKHIAYKMLTEAIFNANNYIEVLQNVWMEIFNLKSKKYLEECVKNKINGITIDLKNNLKYYIVYNIKNII